VKVNLSPRKVWGRIHRGSCDRGSHLLDSLDPPYSLRTTTRLRPRKVKSRVASARWTLLCCRRGLGLHRPEWMDSQVDGSFSKDTSWALVLAWYSGPPGGLICVDGRERDIQGEGVSSSTLDLGRSGNLIEVFDRARASRAAPRTRQLSPSSIQSSRRTRVHSPARDGLTAASRGWLSLRKWT
jgi:hypothetical protein